MVYIYKKIVQGKPYYYLRISKRIKDKVITKDVAYLGNDLNKIQIELDKLPKKYKQEIRKSYRNIKKFIESNYYLKKIEKIKNNPYLISELLKRIESARLHYQKKFLKLDYKTQKSVYDNFLVDFAYNTTSIEGNTITLQEAKKLFQDNLTPKNRTPREIFDLQNTKKVFFYLLKENPVINEKLLIKIHDLLLENIDTRKGYRTHEIRVFKSHFKATPVPYIKADIRLLFEWYEQNKKKMHPLIFAGLFHQKFEKIHPFSDGNGRTGRMIFNYMLLKNKYPPIIIHKKNRAEYLKSLSHADKTSIKDNAPKSFKPLIEYLAGEFIGSYWDNFLI